MRVKKESPVSDKESFLYHWDLAARTYFEHFDILLNNQRTCLQKNFRNILTQWRDASHFYPTFKRIDTLVYRQILGDISKSDVKDVNHALGSGSYLPTSSGHFYYTKSWSQPAAMYAWDKNLLLTWAFWASAAVFGRFIKGYSNVWMVIPFVPCWVHILYNYRHQPYQELENGYKFLIQKRVATVEFERNSSKINSALSKYSKEKKELTDYLKNQSKNMTLYDLEEELYNTVAQK